MVMSIPRQTSARCVCSINPIHPPPHRGQRLGGGKNFPSGILMQGKATLPTELRRWITAK
tara:strand:- start:2959 stop:3138 length:180 start_codon:yes stop_codon:yes gene_type:complete